MRYAPGRSDGYPTVAVAATARFDRAGVVLGVDVALAGVADTPILVEEVLDVVTGAPTAATVASAAEHAAQATSPFDDLRGSAEYKRAMTRVWVERVLLDVLGIGDSPS